MTALPDYTDFVTFHDVISTDVVMRPKTREHFWGYEVAPNEQVINIATLCRAGCGMLTFACVVGAVGLWVMPADLFAGTVLAMKGVMSLILVAVAVWAARVAARGTQIRVQVDTANGELREVVDGAFGTVETLARYGIDAVEAVDIVSSRSEPSYGQVHLHMTGVGKIAVGDGAVLTLRPLRDRLASDCGIVEQNTARVAVWGGPLAA
ncbi:hypothetical protein N8Z54_02290 [Octadecabacter sp.]|nr:hypothetical protein [Octadecabacter sp.]